MRNIISVTVIAICIALQAAGQPPDDDRIRLMVGTDGSPFHYKELKERYMEGDSTLTGEEYHYLYYGYVFQPEYRPLVPIHAQTSLLAVFDASKGEPDIMQLDEMIGYGLEVMEHDPFSLSNINFLTFAYGRAGDMENEAINARRFTALMDVIASSGDGLSEKSPWHVINSTHAKDFLAARGLEVSKRLVVTRTVEYIRLATADNGNKGYYFDFGRMYSKPPEQLPERRSQGLKLEHIGPKYRE